MAAQANARQARIPVVRGAQAMGEFQAQRDDSLCGHIHFTFDGTDRPVGDLLARRRLEEHEVAEAGG